MVTYNKNRTAYKRSTPYGERWHLLPRGRKRAPILGLDGPDLRLGPDSSLVEHLTEEDRAVLLDAEDSGVFYLVLGEVKQVLRDRHFAEKSRRRKVAQEIVDRYRRV